MCCVCVSCSSAAVCYDCIDNCILVGGKANVCPVCKVLLGPNPWEHGKLRYDFMLDSLVRKVCAVCRCNSMCTEAGRQAHGHSSRVRVATDSRRLHMDVQATAALARLADVVMLKLCRVESSGVVVCTVSVPTDTPCCLCCTGVPSPQAGRSTRGPPVGAGGGNAAGQGQPQQTAENGLCTAHAQQHAAGRLRWGFGG